MKVRHPAFTEIVKDVPDADAESWLRSGWKQVVEVKFAKGGKLHKPKPAPMPTINNLEDTQEIDPFLDD